MKSVSSDGYIETLCPMLVAKAGDSFLDWLAGFYDGEGWVHLRVRGSRRAFIMGIAQAGDRGRRVSDELTRVLGMGIVQIQHRGKYQTLYSWRINRLRDIVVLGEVLVPRLHVRGDELRVFLDRVRATEAELKHLAWSELEVKFVLNEGRRMKVPDIASALGRTNDAVSLKLMKLGAERRYDARRYKRDPRGRYIS